MRGPVRPCGAAEAIRFTKGEEEEKEEEDEDGGSRQEAVASGQQAVSTRQL